MSNVLVLNKNFCAINITNWKNAMSLLYQEVATVVDENYVQYKFDDWKELSQMMDEAPNGFVHTPHFKIAVPDIIRLENYESIPKRSVKFTRRNVYQHYGYKCCYCGNKFHTQNLNLDHVVPRSRGGRTNWDNIVTSCIPCNTRKENKTPREAGMKLRVNPSRPKWRGNKSFIEFNGPIEIKTSWQKVIDTAYWDAELKKERQLRSK